MLFVIDIGNTNTVIGIYDGEILIKDWRIRTVKSITEDEINILITSLFSRDNIEINKIERTVISCVVPPMVPILESFCNKYLYHSPVWVNAKSYIKMPILINKPDELGADRIVNSIAAYSKYMKSMIIVDFGTATTFDAISDKGEYIGGAISPGITLAAEALFSGTSKLPRIDIFKPPKFALGKDTVDSMKSGIIFGYAGLVDELVKKLTFEMGSNPLIIFTGGLAPLMLKVTNTIVKLEPLLALEGLRIIGSIC